MPSHYETLEVAVDASQDQIKKAYKKLAMATHPDRPEGNVELFKGVAEAYDILRDPEKRRRYDRGDAHFSNINAFDIFSHFFGSSGYNRRVTPDISLPITIKLESICKAKKMKITYERNCKCDICNGNRLLSGVTKVPVCTSCRGSGAVQRIQQVGFMQFKTSVSCTKCGGEGRVVTPAVACEACVGAGVLKTPTELVVEAAAVVEKPRVRHRRLGHYDRIRGSYGDLEIQISIRTPPGFHMDGARLYRVVKISPYEAVVGFKRSFDHPNGQHITVEVPGVLKDKDVITVPGMGAIKGDAMTLKLKVDKSDPPNEEAWRELQSVMRKHSLLPEEHCTVPPQANLRITHPREKNNP